MAHEPLSPDEAHLWYAWKLASDTVLAHVGRDISEGSPVSVADYAVLSRLEMLGRGEMAQQDLADSLRWDKSRLSHHLTRMEARGLVRRRPSGSRGVLVVLLAKGAKQLAATKPIHAEAVRKHLVGKLNAEQRRQLLALSKLLHDSPPEEEWPVPEGQSPIVSRPRKDRRPGGKPT